jgi:hypothetical protein
VLIYLLRINNIVVGLENNINDTEEVKTQDGKDNREYTKREHRFIIANAKGAYISICIEDQRWFRRINEHHNQDEKHCCI